MPPRKRSKPKRSRPARPRKQRLRLPRGKTGLSQRKDLIEWVTSLKKRPCADCKRLYPSVCMDFDHLPAHRKRFTISQFVRENGHLSNARSLLEMEIAKCEVVCANCHRIRTARRMKGKPFRLW